MIEAIASGRFQITERGRKVLKDSPSRIDNRLLAQFAEFKLACEKSGYTVADHIAEVSNMITLGKVEKEEGLKLILQKNLNGICARNHLLKMGSKKSI